MKPLLLTLTALVAAPCILAFMPAAVTRRETVVMMARQDGSGMGAREDRRSVVLQGLGGMLGLAALTTLPSVASANVGATFEETISTLQQAKKILTPVRRYIEIGQYDPARTNIKYCINQLRLKKNMEKALQLGIDRVEDTDKLDAAAEATALMDNHLVQLDSSVYTAIFIPTEGEITPTAAKYRQQAFEFYDIVMDSIDKVLALANDKEAKAAEQLSAKVELPSFLFKEFAGDFYRPATP